MFTTLMLLAFPCLGFRLLGALGVDRFRSWRVCAAHGLAVMLVATGSAHFAPATVTVIPNHDDLVAMVPPFVPFPHLTIYATGVLELLGALGLVITRTRAAAGICLAALFVLMFPANVHAAIANVPLGGEPPTPLWFRGPEQLVFIATALWAANVITPVVSRAPLASSADRR
jgi:uncharacterized membrane protein